MIIREYHIDDKHIKSKHFMRMQEEFTAAHKQGMPYNYVVMSSKGGNADMIESYLRLFNTYEVVLECSVEMHSAAWLIFYRYQGKKLLGDYFVAAGVHLPSTIIETRDLNDSEGFESILKKNTHEHEKLHTKEAESYLTKNEMVRFKKGKTVYLDRDRVCKICSI